MHSHFTIRTDGTYFIFVYIIVDKRKDTICSVLINFVGGCTFFTVYLAADSYDSTEVEYCLPIICGVGVLFFLVVCVSGCVMLS